MEVIVILIPIAILLALVFIIGFMWMTIRGQYDDLETPAMRMLIEDTNLKSKSNNDTNKERS